jgi:hypothetical protein
MGPLTAGIEFAEFTAKLAGQLLVLLYRFEQGASDRQGRIEAEAAEQAGEKQKR